VKEALFGLFVPWVAMLPFVLVAIAAIEMIKDWLPSRLIDDPTAPMPVAYEEIGVIPGENGIAFRVTDPWAVWDTSTPVDPRLFVSPAPQACRAESTRLDYSTERP
jgi:hypothetical protein